MIISATALTFLIIAATALVALAPLVLILIWLKDSKEGRLW
ncbi:MAG: hypothetical protein PVG66_09615 [Chromatiales bacterium]|jgi:hypothetical protein